MFHDFKKKKRFPLLIFKSRFVVVGVLPSRLRCPFDRIGQGLRARFVDCARPGQEPILQGDGSPAGGLGSGRRHRRPSVEPQDERDADIYVQRR